ncbi:hypothetical protein AB0C60_19320, partial [Streptomyces sp. NPDC048845]
MTQLTRRGRRLPGRAAAGPGGRVAVAEAEKEKPGPAGPWAGTEPCAAPGLPGTGAAPGGSAGAGAAPGRSEGDAVPAPGTPWAYEWCGGPKPSEAGASSRSRPGYCAGGIVTSPECCGGCGRGGGAGGQAPGVPAGAPGRDVVFEGVRFGYRTGGEVLPRFD